MQDRLGSNTQSGIITGATVGAYVGRFFGAIADGWSGNDNNN